MMAGKREHPRDGAPAMPADRYREQIRTEQVRQLYALGPLGIVATFINSLLVFFVMQDAVGRGRLIPWLAAISVVTILRIILLLRFRAIELTPANAAPWGRRFLAGLAAIGAAWGSIGLLPLADVSIAHQVFLAFVLGGMAAGAASTYSTVKHAYAAFSIPALAPLTIHFFLLEGTFHYAMAAMTTLFALLLWRIAEHNYGISRDSFLLRFENHDVIERLQKAKEDVEALNAQLVAEIEAKLNAEAELRSHHAHLEETVRERTADLLAANRQLAAARDAAEAANRAKSEFVANMSHEMRTPLGGILGMLRLALDMPIGVEERQLLEMAKRSGESLLRIIADVLDFSRMEAGKLIFEEKPFALAEVIHTAMEVVALHAREKGLRLTCQVADTVPPQLLGDAGRLRQILVNLLGNAVKFTTQGEIGITVRLLDEAEGKKHLLFAIRDTGAGIPADQLENIFGKFTQIDSSLTKQHGGTGLGLALTRQIVEKMGGRIWAESRLGAGSTFYFTLRLAEVPPPAGRQE